MNENGGHLASNLGTVEMTIALHSVLNAPTDKLIFDVGHQCYTHKLLTGRNESFNTLRKFGGISGFTRPYESEYDLVASGHASDSISLALGFAKARDLKGEDYNVAVVLGDGALTGGMCYEALNDAGQSKTRMLIVLNDNEMSISHNVGSMSKHLTHMRQSNFYRGFKQFLRKLINRMPKGGGRLERFLSRIKDSLKALLVSDMFFEALNIEYLGPIDGHDIKEMERVFKTALTYEKPVVVHVVTKKGYGYEPAEKNPSAYHGVNAKSHASEEKAVSCGKAVSDWLIKKAATDDTLVCISAAMLSGTGLDTFSTVYPDRCFDVAIAEAHGAAFAAGLALNGMKPYIALYSTFAQRAYDQININICLNRAPVKILIDRSGLNGPDGETHQGVFDTGFLSALPNLTVAAPATVNELYRMLSLSYESCEPFAVKYPKALPEGNKCDAFLIGSWHTAHKGHDVAIITYGRMLSVAEKALDLLKAYGLEPTLVNARFIKPIDVKLLQKIINSHKLIFVVEDSVESGSLGQKISEYTKSVSLCVPDSYIPAGTVEEQLKLCGLDAETIADKIMRKARKEGLCF